MPLPRPFLATSTQALLRSVLLSLGMDHTLIDFLASVAVGAVAVLLAILLVASTVSRRSAVLIRRTNLIPTALRRIPK